MKKVEIRLIQLLTIFLVLNTQLNVQTTQINAWGFTPHQGIAVEAIKALPDTWAQFLNLFQQDLESSAILPDLRKNGDPYEGPKHWDDSDILHQDYNVSVDSPDYQLGVVSWATENATKDLAKSLGQGDDRQIVEHFGVVSHYAADAAQPFHATANYNGQFTGNDGIHSRFETSLVINYYQELFNNISLEELRVVDPYNETKGIIATGLSLVPEILDADNQAKSITNDLYTAEYYDEMYILTGTILHQRIKLAIQHTANLWYTALTWAGKINSTENTSTNLNTTLEQINSISQGTTSYSDLLIKNQSDKELNSSVNGLMIISTFTLSSMVVVGLRRKRKT